MIKKGREHLTRSIINEEGVPGSLPEGWRVDEDGNIIDEAGYFRNRESLEQEGRAPSEEFKKMRALVKKQQPSHVSENVIDELTRINLRFKKQNKEKLGNQWIIKKN